MRILDGINYVRSFLYETNLTWLWNWRFVYVIIIILIFNGFYIWKFVNLIVYCCSNAVTAALLTHTLIVERMCNHD